MSHNTYCATYLDYIHILSLTLQKSKSVVAQQKHDYSHIIGPTIAKCGITWHNQKSYATKNNQQQSLTISNVAWWHSILIKNIILKYISIYRKLSKTLCHYATMPLCPPIVPPKRWHNIAFLCHLSFPPKTLCFTVLGG